MQHTLCRTMTFHWDPVLNLPHAPPTQPRPSLTISFISKVCWASAFSLGENCSCAWEFKIWKADHHIWLGALSCSGVTLRPLVATLEQHNNPKASLTERRRSLCSFMLDQLPISSVDSWVISPQLYSQLLYLFRNLDMFALPTTFYIH